MWQTRAGAAPGPEPGTPRVPASRRSPALPGSRSQGCFAGHFPVNSALSRPAFAGGGDKDGEINLIYCQSNLSRVMRHNHPRTTSPYSSFLPGLNFTPELSTFSPPAAQGEEEWEWEFTTLSSLTLLPSQGGDSSHSSPYSTVGSLPRATVLYELQHASFPRAAVLHDLLSCGSCQQTSSGRAPLH